DAAIIIEGDRSRGTSKSSEHGAGAQSIWHAAIPVTSVAPGAACAIALPTRYGQFTGHGQLDRANTAAEVRQGKAVVCRVEDVARGEEGQGTGGNAGHVAH